MEGVLIIVLLVTGCALAVVVFDSGVRNGWTRRIHIQSPGWSWIWSEQGVIVGERVSLLPVTIESAAEFWSAQQGDILEINGADPAVTSLVWQAVEAPTAYQLFQGHAAIHLCDSAPTLIGGISTALQEDASIELGIWLAPEQRGLGLGTEALQLAIEHWSSLGYAVRLSTSVGNEAMLRVAEKVGLERFGTGARTLPNGEVLLGANFRVAESDVSAAPSSTAGER